MTTQTHISNTHTVSSIRSLRPLIARYRTIVQPANSTGARRRIPHPGDILYWVGCVSAVSALLFFATR